MIAAWFGTKALGLQRWIWLAILLAALIGGVLWLQAREEADDRANQEIGAKVQREGDLRKTIERAEKANEARDDITRNRDNAKYRQCLQTARTPANCERLRIVQED
jgi:hypothetical protein